MDGNFWSYIKKGLSTHFHRYWQNGLFFQFKTNSAYSCGIHKSNSTSNTPTYEKLLLSFLVLVAVCFFTRLEKCLGTFWRFPVTPFKEAHCCQENEGIQFLQTVQRIYTCTISIQLVHFVTQRNQQLPIPHHVKFDL